MLVGGGPWGDEEELNADFLLAGWGWGFIFLW